MNFINRWFRKKVSQALIENSRNCEAQPGLNVGLVRTISQGNSIETEKSIRFTVSKASGGMIVETNFYDRMKDRSNQGLYIITDDKDLGVEISKIITMETLKQ